MCGIEKLPWVEINESRNEEITEFPINTLTESNPIPIHLIHRNLNHCYVFRSIYRFTTSQNIPLSN